MRIEVLPSLLAADFGNLEREAQRAEACGGDALHLDVMDGVFVPNISMGPAVVEMARRVVKMPLSVHLMIIRPDRYLSTFVDAGADSLLVHIESEADIPETLERIRDLGARAGVTLNPETPAEMVFPALESADELLCMTVHPGYGGQSFIATVLPKIRALRDYADSIGRQDLRILVDGGINLETARQCAAQGADSFIAGTFLYRAADMAEITRQLRSTATKAYVH